MTTAEPVERPPEERRLLDDMVRLTGQEFVDPHAEAILADTA